MFNITRQTCSLGGQEIIFETGRLARQATGSLLVTCNDTSVLATVVIAKEPRSDVDFLPLTVNYQEKFYAAGKIPGGFFRREGRPTENEILISRLIDRPLRPLFKKGFYHETQVTISLLSYDTETQPDILAIIAASGALQLAGAPFEGPISAARVGYKNGEFLLNPDFSEVGDSDLDLVVAGRNEGILMVESEARELSEKIMLDALAFAQKSFDPVIKTLQSITKTAGKDVISVAIEELIAPSDVEKKFGNAIQKAYQEPHKQKRQEKLSTLKEEVLEHFAPANEEGVSSPKLQSATLRAFKEVEKKIVRTFVLKEKKRIDGRDLRTVRPIEVSTGILPRAHGSALFTRGETQALVVTTLGSGSDEKIIDALEGERKEHFMLHYNFPSFSVGEIGRGAGFVGRREVGHGKLAWRALRPLMPEKASFPYAIRLVSEILESNGSSSMATVCGGSLALMDAGVPLLKPVSGIAMGLIKEGDDFVVLSDILGDEDHLGDMDFKVAGSENGITALQMDIKVLGVSHSIMEVALEQAREGRLHILNIMGKNIDEARSSLGAYAPRIHSMTIPQDKIREVIGKGGRVIQDIQRSTNTKVEINDEGVVKISSPDEERIQEAVRWVKSIIAEPEVGVVYEGKVVKVLEFGAFVNFLGARDGLVHISQLAAERVKNVSDVVSEGDIVKVVFLGLDERGRVRLSMKDAETAKD